MTDSQKPSEQKLVPDFAVDETEAAEWGPLTESNPDYEKLWSGAAWEPPAEAPAPSKAPATPPGKERPAETTTAPSASPKSADGAKAAPAPAVDTPGFQGTLVTGDEVLTASMVVSPEIIVLWGGGHEIGSWNHEEAKIARLAYARFAIQAEGDTLTFTADDPTSLDEAITAAVPVPIAPLPEAVPEEAPTLVPPPAAAGFKRTRKKSLKPPPEPVAEVPVEEPKPDIALPAEAEVETIADTVRAKSTSTTVKARRFSLTPQAALIKVGVFVVVAAVLAGLVYLGLLVTGRLGGDETTDTTLENPPTTGVPVIITTAPLPTVATTLAPAMTTLFETDSPMLIERWNGLASSTDVPILLPPELTSPFFLLLTPNLTLEGVLDPVAGNVTLRAAPTGTPEGDAPIFTALGLFVATADPTLDGSDRRALLAQLGLDVNAPELAGIDGTLAYNGLSYRLLYDQASNSLSLAVTPEAAPATTTN